MCVHSLTRTHTSTHSHIYTHTHPHNHTHTHTHTHSAIRKQRQAYFGAFPHAGGKYENLAGVPAGKQGKGQEEKNGEGSMNAGAAVSFLTKSSHITYEPVMSHMNESCHVSRSCHI